LWCEDGFRHFNRRHSSGNARVPLPVLRAHTTADIRIGMALEIDDEPLLVQHFQHVKPGKGAAFVRTKLKASGMTRVLNAVLTLWLCDCGLLVVGLGIDRV
jgi:hypothetical protein